MAAPFSTTAWLFWLSLAVLFYTYFGYGLLLSFLGGLRQLLQRPDPSFDEDWPPVTVIIPAFEEEIVLRKKLQNSLSLDYPPGRLQVVLVTEGREEPMARIVKDFPEISWLHQPQREGKFAALQRAMREVNTPLVVFTDANTLLDPFSLRKMIPHFQDPRTGGVAGEKKVRGEQALNAVGEAEGWYWQYESWLKRADARYHSVLCAAGELFAIRRTLFPVLEQQPILDDFVISLKIRLAGYRIAYEPQAWAVESPSLNLQEEEKRKCRIAAGAWQAIGMLRPALNPFRHPFLAFQFFSGRILRWFVCPFLLVFLPFSNLLLVLRDEGAVYTAFFLVHWLFYLLAGLGWWQLRSGRGAALLTIPFYFLFMHFSQVKGMLLSFRHRPSPLWEKSRREAVKS